MDGDAVMATLRSHARELRARGVADLSLFGSTVRGEAGPNSDIDLVVRLRQDFASPGLAYFGKLAELREPLVAILQAPVDLVTEPVRKQSLRETIERDRRRAF